MVDQTIPGIRSGGHTRGPWVAEEDDAQFVIAALIGDVGELRRTEEANARLIAAAPELLEAVQNLLGLFDNAVYRRKLADDALYPHVISQARAASAKASPTPSSEVRHG